MKRAILLAQFFVFLVFSYVYASKVITKPIIGYEFKGKVVKVKKIPGFRRSQIIWWAIDVKNKDGKEVEVRLAPVWLYHNIEIKNGDKLEIKGFIPPYWLRKGFNAIMACRVEDKDTDVIYDFSKIRKWCQKVNFSKNTFPEFDGFSNSSTIKNGIIKGKVIVVKKGPGIRKRKIWWILEIENAEDVYTIYIAPIFRLPTLDISLGDKLLVKVYTPPRWKALNLKNTYMACYIKDISNGVEMKLRKCY